MQHEQEQEIINKAVEALRQRLGEDAVRYLAKRVGEDVENIQWCGVNPREFVRLTKLRAGTAEEFVIALANNEEANLEDRRWYRDARAPLPDDLKVLRLEYQDLREPSDAFEELFGALGLYSLHKPGEITCFGKVNKTRKRVDVVMPASDCGPHSYYLSTTFDFARRNGLPLAHHDIANGFAHRYEVGDEFLHWDKFDAVGGFQTDFERPGEFERWARAAAKRAERWLMLRTACNGNAKEMLKVVLQRQQESPRKQEFVVEGLIPRGVVTLLLARKGVGKTNALLELAVAVAERRATWWNFKLRPGEGFVVFLLGEGSRDEAEERVLAMNDGEWPTLLKLEKFNDSTMIEDILTNMKESGIKVDLLIVDPARKYYRGDEDSSDAVSAFFTKVEAFADQTKAGLVVSHHLKREANPKNIHEVPFYLRGSQVWLDRPRVILAMHRQREVTTFGIPVPKDGDPLHNLRASAMFAGVLKLQRDADTFTHAPIDAAASKKAASNHADERVHDEDALVLAAITRLLADGERINFSFKRELFSFKPPRGSMEIWEPGDMTRAEGRAAVRRLIDNGQVLRDASGALHLPRK
jgi:AAA domain